MPTLSCTQCGATLNEAAPCCPVCGFTLPMDPHLREGETDPRITQAHQLAEEARLCQQDGDLVTALRQAREALSLHPDCSTIHALLGHLYEQNGNQSAARYHFQAALDIKPGAMAEPSAPLPSETPASPQQNPWMAAVLVGCILFSGLAAILSLWPEKHHVERGAIIQMPVDNRPPLEGEPPHWRWQPPEVAREVTVVTPDRAPARGTAATVVPEDVPLKAAKTAEKVSKQSSSEEKSAIPVVLGPSTRPRVVAEPVAPSVEQADQAYFRGEYERAVIVYEDILQREDAPHPRLHQDLAWCYQQLGNSGKAALHLQQAVQGYQTMAAESPDNTTAHQGLTSCRAALSTLLATKEPSATP